MSTEAVHLDGATWPALADRAARMVLVVPLGSTEQHGPHLPFTTDTDIAVALATRLAALRPVALAPPLAYGSSGEHAHFAGTLSIGGPVLTDVLVQLVRSADAFAGVVLLNAHGGNEAAVKAAVEVLSAEGRRALAWSPRLPGADAHAGRTETSVMLALHPDRVEVAQATAGNVGALRDLMPALRIGGVAAVSPNGVLGDPTGASAAEGIALLSSMTDDLLAAFDRWSDADRRSPA